MPRHLPLPILALAGAAFLYGTTFVLVKQALEDYPPYAFLGWRFLLGGLILAAFSVPSFRSHHTSVSGHSGATGRSPSRQQGGIWRDGWVTGGMLFAGYALQTSGLELTSASNSALITGLFIVFTPLIAAVVYLRWPSLGVTLGTAGAFIGMVLITYQDGPSIGSGEILTLGCAIAFAAHLVALSAYARKHLVIPFTAIQLLVVAGLSFLFSWLQEDLTLPPSSVWGAIVITGLLVSAGAFLLQTWAQTMVGPGPAAITLSMEPMFGVAAGALVLNETFDRRGWLGAVLIIVSVVGVTVITRKLEISEGEAITPAH